MSNSLLIERDHLVEWFRGPARQEGDWIVLDAARAEPYSPIEEGELMYDLAGVRGPAGAVSFVERYGLVRHRGDDKFRERWRDIEDDAATLLGTMRLVAQIRDATNNGVSDDDRQRSNDGVRDLRKFSDRLIAGTGQPPPSNDDDVIRLATQAAVWQVNVGLEGVQSRIAGYPGGRFAFTVTAPTLLAMAYQQLAQAIAERVPMRECEECGRFFEVKRSNQRFHSNTCAGRARQRRFAAKAAQ